MSRKFTFVVVAAALLALPTSASATVTCNLAGGVLTVDVTGTGDQTAGLRMEAGGTEIAVYDTIDFSAGKQNCGTTPTTANTNTIAVADTDPGSTQRTILKISLVGGPFVNGVAEGGGTQEIEITFDGAEESNDDILFDGGPGPAGDNWRMGELAGGHGFQLDDTETGTVDVDDVVASNVEQLQLGISGNNPGDDIYDARGGSGFTGPLAFSTSVKQLVGGDGNDQIFGGDGNGWRLEGDLGSDTLIGGPGNDQIQVAFGTEADTADGNGGTDNCSYLNHGTAVQVDLRITAPQNTVGAGTDTLSDCEDLTGGAESDTLIGTNGPNSISGGETSVVQTGADTLIGLDGSDALSGSHGSDTVSYAQGSTAPVIVDLANAGAQNTGGAGTDTITDVENLTGSPFGGDVLTGTNTSNVITGYGDGLADTIDCVNNGGDADTAILDELGVESPNNCETIDNAPQTSVNSGPPNGSTTADTTPTYGISADEPSAFQFSVDGGSFSGCTASCDVSALSDGAHTLRFRAVDGDENQNPDPTPVQRTIAIDTTGPTIQIDDRPADLTNSPNPSWQFSGGEGGLSFECQVDGAGFAPCNAGPAHSAGSLPDGPHTFAVRGRDAVGNAGPTLTDDFTVDRTGPEIQISQRPAEASNDNTPTWQFSSGEANVTYTCMIDGGDPVPCSGPGAAHTAATLADGMHGLVVFGRDALGNQGTTVSDQLTIDTRAPNTDAPKRVKTRKKRVKVPFDVDEQGVTSECSFDDGAFKPCSSPFRTPKMKRGTKHTLEIRSTDQAGNADPSAAAVKIKRKR